MPKIKYPYQFDPKKRKIASEYRRAKLIMYFLSLIISLATGFFILYGGLHLAIKDFVVQYPLETITYPFLVLTIFSITGLPLSFYSSFIFDHKFKIATYKLSGWITDYLKGTLIYFVFSLIVIAGLYFSIRTFDPWWFTAGILYVIFSISMNYIFPFLIIPFMWKTETYKDKSMRARILKLCKNIGVNGIKNVIVIKESEKSVRPNAVFTGFGNSKEIGLFDTLLTTFTKDEIETVIGHELGHYINRDILKGVVLEAVLIFPILYLTDHFVNLYSPMFGINGINDLAMLPLFGIIYGTLNFLLMPLSNTFSRWMESKADKFALEHVRKPVAQVSTEKRLADLHLDEVEPNPIMEFWFRSHPSAIRRIRMAENWKRAKLKR
ncbi:MAG: M48 family metallopeptidase [Candidatus Aenigmarchaeota archaeon]|nr:M48 family metallopeptidase [Candidatus Aenigmarchaeota archaeon]